MKKCVLCNSNSRYKKVYTFSEGDIYVCQKCGLAFFNGIAPHSASSEYKESKFFRLIKRIFLFLEFGYLKKKDKMRLLEIGSGSGVLANYLSSMGHKVVCCDINKKSIDAIRKKYNLETIYGAIESIKLKENYFDGILMRHVFEHIDSPDICINVLYSALKVNGFLCMTTPNYESWARLIAGKKWNWFIPSHRYFWSEKTLSSFLEKRGFKVIKSQNIFTHNGVSYALDNLVPFRIIRYLLRPITLPIGLILEIISINFHRGQNLFIEAKKCREKNNSERLKTKL